MKRALAIMLCFCMLPTICGACQASQETSKVQNSFGVGAPITRQDMCKIPYGMLSKMTLFAGAGCKELTFRDAQLIAPYATLPVSTLVSLGIIKGDDLGKFNPQNNATRQEAAKLIYGMLALYVQ